mmetsp:Transcript_31732/g.53530  ORF Transcript_31732/g.53530 Transcript_31732/m.53530 type:complete len:376 (-) Transcript_31732:146-1273(-)|eukprot:CAMPEP_0174956730 /NCGR_PEP_ID=MMETSP0004_2-20121128/1685_1 /TAXON_ID=420556 /ORGANISM="Ochromonas sp., Strain CCMP1393" /LENGTH=375 /DNA_ID=CAMNT_0016204773 /DNA_START=44 /DNA_END=1171 /DNA_ORIENTATION=+
MFVSTFSVTLLICIFCSASNSFQLKGSIGCKSAHVSKCTGAGRTLLRSSSTLKAVRAIESIENWDLQLSSPCKLNLFLRILGRRPNGFHDLASLFQTISLSDKLYFSKLDDKATADEMTCSDKMLTVDQNNLVIKALDLMRKRTGLTSQYFKVYLEKTVPMQAGLGGGSGNAATAMHAFNCLCGYPASEEQLLDWSGEIGSDISFFFSTGTAYCTGRGEIVDSLGTPLPDAEFVVVDVFKPSEGLSTGKVFNALDLSKCHAALPGSILESFTRQGPLRAATDDQLINDLESPAFQCEPMLAALKEKISANSAVRGVMMSGSGTSIFSLRDARQLDSDSNHKNDSFVTSVLEEFPTTQHFQCSFVARDNNVKSWYK